VPIPAIEHGNGILRIALIVEVDNTRSLEASMVIVQVDVEIATWSDTLCD
jgi:hypothetical protein